MGVLSLKGNPCLSHGAFIKTAKFPFGQSRESRSLLDILKLK